MAKKTPKTELQLQYEREYKRIKQAVNRQAKGGYFIPPELLPDKPSSKNNNITPEEVARLAEITPKYIRKHSYFIDKDSGEAFYGLDVVRSNHKAKPSEANIRPNGGKKKRKASTPKPQDKIPPKESNLNTKIIDDISDLLNAFDHAIYWKDSMRAKKAGIRATLSLMWEEVLDMEGEYEVAYRLEGMADELRKITNRLLYDSKDTYSESMDMGRFGEILFGRPFTQSESDYYSDFAFNTAASVLGTL